MNKENRDKVCKMKSTHPYWLTEYYRQIFRTCSYRTTIKKVKMMGELDVILILLFKVYF